MTIIDRQIETIALACAVTPETVRAVIDGQRVGDSAGERVRAALTLIGFIAPIPRVAMPCVVREVEHNRRQGHRVLRQGAQVTCSCDHDARDLCANATESRFRLDPSCECECHDGKATLADVLDEMSEDERADFVEGL